jgi:uncharacterized protein
VRPDQAFLDTSFVLALENRADPYHRRALELDRELLALGTELVLHWGVVLEIGDGYARLGRRAKGFDLIRRFETESGYRVEPIDDGLYRAAVRLYLGRADKEWGLTDCVSFELMRREGIQGALTADAHFRQAGFTALLLEPGTPG